MKKKLLALLSIIFLFTLASCDFSKNSDESIKQAGYDCIVTYDANGGTIGNYDVRRIYCKEGSYVLEPGDQGLPSVALSGYTFGGWYLNKECTGEAFDVKNTKITESITLYAKWNKYYTINIKYGPEGSETSRTTSINSESATEAVAKPTQSPKLTGYTFFDYYEDAAYTKVYEWGSVPTYDENREFTIYAKFLKGSYVFATSYDDIKSISASTCIYLENDIDCEGKTIKLPAEYRGTIIGNGYTISNFKIEYTQSGITETAYGLFRKISGAKISDITFDNVEVTATVGRDDINQYYAGVFAGTIEESTISNVKVKNVKVTITLDNVDASKFITDTSKYYGKADTESAIDIKEFENNELSFA